MDIILIIWTLMMSVAVVFVMTEHIVGTKLKDDNRFKKWWRKNITSFLNGDKPLGQSNSKKLLYLVYVR